MLWQPCSLTHLCRGLWKAASASPMQSQCWRNSLSASSVGFTTNRLIAEIQIPDCPDLLQSMGREGQPVIPGFPWSSSHASESHKDTHSNTPPTTPTDTLFPAPSLPHREDSFCRGAGQARCTAEVQLKPSEEGLTWCCLYFVQCRYLPPTTAHSHYYQVVAFTLAASNVTP